MVKVCLFIEWCMIVIGIDFKYSVVIVNMFIEVDIRGYFIYGFYWLGKWL